jgi:hypothetical protein
MIHYGCPNRCWDDCFVMEAYVRSHTALDIFSWEDQVPKSKVKGEPADISPTVTLQSTSQTIRYSGADILVMQLLLVL